MTILIFQQRGKCCMVIICLNCEKEFKRKPSQVSRAKRHFCSRECKNEYLDKYHMVVCNCHQCDKEFKIKKGHYKRFENGEIKNLFCSQECKADYESTLKQEKHWKYNRIPVTCKWCGGDYSVIPSQLNRTNFCSKECQHQWLNVYSKTEEFKENMRKASLLGKKFTPSKLTKPERFTLKYLEEHNIEYIPQHLMYDKFTVDFYLPALDIVIEVLGDYWHGHPDKFGEGENKKPLTDRQKHTKQNDDSRCKYLTKCEHKVYMIWECDIYKDIENTMSFLFV